MKEFKILLDNGHGKNTAGKRSPDGRLREYAWTRKAVRGIVARLTAAGYDAEAIVPEEGDISLGQRVARVNRWCDQMGAKRVLLVSVHNNAAGAGGWMNARGWEAWTSPGQTGGDALADCMYQAAGKCLPQGTKIRTDFADGDADKEARFTVLTQSKCPAVLTENLFQDNRQDVEYLLSDEGLEAIVDLHVTGIEEYIKRMNR